MDYLVSEKSGAASQQAIERAAQAGGGRVVLEPGVYLSGTLYLRSNIELHIPAGAKILGESMPERYDDFRHPGFDALAPEGSRKCLIAAAECEYISITGGGEIDGNGPLFYDRNVPPGKFFVKPPHPRPRMVQLYRCRNVFIDGVSFLDSPGWSFWLIACDDVHFSRIRIVGCQLMTNNDGIDIVDCNAGDHHKAFATNFNPEINIREITQKGLYWQDGKWVETEPLEIHKPLTYPEIGPKESYLLHHEEIESLVKNYPTIKRARFWMTFGQEYLTHLRVIQNIGMASIKPINYEGHEIVPLQFLKAVLPNPQDLGENYEGQTSIGCRIRGLKDGKEHTYYVYNNCSHRAAYEETGMQGVSYTTGVPAMIGARMFMLGLWKKPGVWNVEEFDPDPFMEELNKQGLPWHEIHDGDLEL